MVFSGGMRSCERLGSDVGFHSISRLSFALVTAILSDYVVGDASCAARQQDLESVLQECLPPLYSIARKKTTENRM